MLSRGLLFALGTGGGLVFEFIRIYPLRYTPAAEWPDWIRSPSYWVVGSATSVFGGLLSWLTLSGTHATWPAAVLVGIGGAALVPELARSVPAPRGEADVVVDRRNARATKDGPRTRAAQGASPSRLRRMMGWWTAARIQALTAVAAFIVALLTYLTK
jgi:hypothetical protein